MTRRSLRRQRPSPACCCGAARGVARRRAPDAQNVDAARCAVRRPAVDVRAHPLHGLDGAAAAAPQSGRRALVHRRPGRRTEPVAPRPHRRPPSRSTIRSCSRSRIPNLWTYPWIYIVEPGNLRLKDAEVPILREFLLRGGTLTFDDFHGPIEWANLEQRAEARLSRSQDRRPAAGASDLPLLLPVRRLSADAGARLVPPGTHVGEGRLRRAPARDRGRQRPRDGAHQLERRHGRRLGVVERGGVSRLREIHGAWRTGWRSTKSSTR